MLEPSKQQKKKYFLNNLKRSFTVITDNMRSVDAGLGIRSFALHSSLFRSRHSLKKSERQRIALIAL